MKTATVTEFRSNMKECLQELDDDQDILVLSGPKKRDYVVLTLETFNAMEETAYLQSTKNNTKRLTESIGQDQKGKLVIRKLSLEEQKNSKITVTKTRDSKSKPMKRS